MSLWKGEDVTLISMRCMKCGLRSNSKKNPETTYAIRQANNSYDGWLCKCGYYNATDP